MTLQEVGKPMHSEETIEDVALSEVARWDPTFTAKVKDKVYPLVRRWFRPEVRDMTLMPSGAALVVSNHSGGMFTPDPFVFGAQFYDTFGYDRPLYTLAHKTVMLGPLESIMLRIGVIHASRDNAAEALASGAAVLVFPGGDYDSYRPTSRQNAIDFNGRTGYVRTAIEAGVPIVPTVSIGAQESQLFLSRGTGLAERLGLDKKLRLKIMPLSVGFPFGVSFILPPNLPLPTKIVTQVLQPIDVAAEFGADPDIEEVDSHIRSQMQAALGTLAEQRRFPVIG
jgi:1-acyl-sn-glycerol-3-phosphate acyltransferase